MLIFFYTRTSFHKLTNEYKLPVWNYEIHLEELAKEGFSTGMESHLRNSLHLIIYWLLAYFSTKHPEIDIRHLNCKNMINYQPYLII